MDILITGPNFHAFRESIAKSFRNLGFQVDAIGYPELELGIKFQTWALMYKWGVIDGDFQSFRLRYDSQSIERYNKSLLSYVTEKNPNTVLVLKGDLVLPETLRKIQSQTTTTLVLWCYDKATRFPAIVDGVANYDLVYTFEPSDISFLKDRGVKPGYLLMAFDPELYRDLNLEPTRDLVFVGRLYQNRKTLFNRILEAYPDVKFEIWGKAWTWYNPLLQYEYRVKFPKLRESIHNYTISPEQVNEEYNRSKLCLNQHHDQNVEGFNPRVFQVMGSKSFLLTDYKPKLAEFFSDGEDLAWYRDEEELFEKIEYYLENDEERRRIAANGFEKVKENHTHRHRAQRILSDVEAHSC